MHKIEFGRVVEANERESPCLEWRLLHREEPGDILTLSLALLDAEGEILVGYTIGTGLSSINWGMNLEPDIKQGPWEEVCLIRREDATQCRARSQTLECLSRS